MTADGATADRSTGDGSTGDRSTGDQHIVVYGDFNCPWSYLASRRSALLAADGMKTDWRAVEHEVGEPAAVSEPSERFDDLRREMDEVDQFLLAGELLPFALAGFLPHTGAAIEGYAEAYATGPAGPVREQLFEALWLHSLDLADPEVVHTLVVDAVRSATASEHERWDYAPRDTGGADGTEAARLVRQWADEWRGLAEQTIPTVLVEGVHPLHGVAAVDWLGRQLMDRGLAPISESVPEHP